MDPEVPQYDDLIFIQSLYAVLAEHSVEDILSKLKPEGRVFIFDWVHEMNDPGPGALREGFEVLNRGIETGVYSKDAALEMMKPAWSGVHTLNPQGPTSLMLFR